MKEIKQEREYLLGVKQKFRQEIINQIALGQFVELSPLIEAVNLSLDEAILIVENWRNNSQTALLNYYGLALLNLNILTIKMVDRDRKKIREEGSSRR